MLSDIPKEYLCPITKQLMHNPVLAADGHYYERAAIESWLKGHDTSFITNERFVHKNLKSCTELQQAIKEFVYMNSKVSVSRKNSPPSQEISTIQLINSSAYGYKLMKDSLREAIEQNNMSLINSCAQINRKLLIETWDGGYTAFHLACEKSNFDTLLYVCGLIGNDFLALSKFLAPPAWKPKHLDMLYLYSCSKRSVPFVETCLRMGADVNVAYTSDFRSSLHEAVKRGDNELVKLLLRNNINPYLQDDEGNSALHLAALLGNQIIVATLLRYGVVDIPNRQDLFAYDVALNFNQLAVADILMKRPPLSDEKMSRLTHKRSSNESKEKPWGFQGETMLVISEISTPQASSPTEINLFHPIASGQSKSALILSFKEALVQNNIPVITSCLQLNGDLLFQIWDNGYTAFHLACEKSSFETLLYLCDFLEDAFLQLGNLPKPQDWKPQHLNKLYLFLCQKRDATFVKTCLDLGADVNAHYEANARSALHVAVNQNDINIVKLLLPYEINPYREDEEGYLPLQLAVMSGKEEMVAVMLNANVADKTNSEGISAYALAIKLGYSAIATLLDKNPSVNQAPTQSKRESSVITSQAPALTFLNILPKLEKALSPTKETAFAPQNRSSSIKREKTAASNRNLKRLKQEPDESFSQVSASESKQPGSAKKDIFDKSFNKTTGQAL